MWARHIWRASALLKGSNGRKANFTITWQRTGDTAFLNADDPDLCVMAAQRPELKTVRYGVYSYGAEILPVSAAEPYLRLRLPEGLTVSTHLIGSYNAPNVMAAICIGRYFGVSARGCCWGGGVLCPIPICVRSLNVPLTISLCWTHTMPILQYEGLPE